MNNKIYKCVHCGRNLGAKVAHRCKGTMRKRRLQFRNCVSGQIEPQVKPEIAEIKKENKKFKEAIKKIYQTAVCGNNNIGKWGLEEYCYNLLNDSNFTA